MTQRARPRWTEDLYGAAINAVTNRRATMPPGHHEYIQKQIELAQTAEVLRYERDLFLRRQERRSGPRR